MVVVRLLIGLNFLLFTWQFACKFLRKIVVLCILGVFYYFYYFYTNFRPNSRFCLFHWDSKKNKFLPQYRKVKRSPKFGRKNQTCHTKYAYFDLSDSITWCHISILMLIRVLSCNLFTIIWKLNFRSLTFFFRCLRTAAVAWSVKVFCFFFESPFSFHRWWQSLV